MRFVRLPEFGAVSIFLSKGQCSAFVSDIINLYITTDQCSTSLALTAGHLPYVFADRTIEQASTSSNPYKLPATLHHMVVVQVFCNKVHSAMGELDRVEASTSRPKRASTLRLLEVDFQELQRRLSPFRSRTSYLCPLCRSD